MQEAQLNPLRRARQERSDAVVEGGELGVAVDRVRRLRVGYLVTRNDPRIDGWIRQKYV